MRYLFVLLVAGCATDFHADQYEGNCARSCLAGYDRCIAYSAPLFRGTCDSTTHQCMSTCPPR